MPVENNVPFSPDFRPILQVGNTARLIRGNPSNFVDVEILGVFGLGVHRHDFGTLTTSALNLDCTHLDMDQYEFAVYRYVPRGRFRMHMQLPNGVDVYRTQGSVKGSQVEGFFIDGGSDDVNELPAIRNAMWAMSEFVTWERETPRFDAYGLAPAAQVEMYVDFYGYGFACKPADKIPPVSLWVNGRPRGHEPT